MTPYQDVVNTIEMRINLLIIIALLATSCKKEVASWVLNKEVSLGEVAPIGLDFEGDDLWISDGDNNKVIKMDTSGQVLLKIDGLERPMHLDVDGDIVYIPEYGNDHVLKIQGSKRDTITASVEFDAPAGVHADDGEMAIADFYNHQVIVGSGESWEIIGKKGKSDGEFHYPTDVQLVDNLIYVADAYNNRIQIFDRQSKEFVRTIGSDFGMNAATGIFVTKNNLFITDFENDRVLVLDENDTIVQTIDQLSKPTDVIAKDGYLYIINYKSKTLSIYQLR